MDILKELHVSIAEACEASFDQAFRNMESQNAIRDAKLSETTHNAATTHMAQQTAHCKIYELQCHITALQDELSHYEASKNYLELPGKYANLEHDFAPHHIWQRNLHDADQLREVLEQKYAALYSNLQTIIESWISLKSKVLQHKRKLRHWDRQLQRDEFTLLVDGAPVTFRRIKPMETEDAIQNTNLQHDTTIERLHSETGVSLRPESVAITSPSAQNEDCAADATNNIKAEPCSTQMAISPRIQLNANPPHSIREPTSSEASSETPRHLPELQLRKRKRIVPPVTAQTITGNLERPVLVKNEPVSSPIQSSNNSLGQPFPSTQDLDQIGDTVQTPIKRNVYKEVHWEPGFLDREPSCAPEQPHPQSSVLQSNDDRTCTGKVLAKEPGMRKQKAIDYRAIWSMAEDGDAGDLANSSQKSVSSSSATVQAGLSKTRTNKTASHGRLEGLLEGSMPSKSLPKSICHVNGRQEENDNARRNRGNTGTTSPRLRPRTLPVSEQTSQSGPHVYPEEEPYRSRPLHRLNLEHFKINPAANHGLPYAYNEVVRRKEERKCLPGCTRPGCCGDRFRAMARLGGFPASTSTEQNQENQRTLEEYVGDDLDSLNHSSAPTRENLLVEARARMIANQYGRHRHSHQRARTPPGFWRTDMPSTQEVESDREAARTMEREKVEERYREALRPGGLWTWADE
ncbi:DNA repair protein Sae2/CtIP [Penicillium hispanicum]|uniref:DNA repair protein Sae2/CtIP n=1 Tax=Penicillium hispanicum TaxID=1080232 RepID=UPI002541D56A|nr:DNA repair protein Sae2/CtIP [Penicillium hispanicum]KAJ5584112.1 DNA repair protein Sae2/CtIP [Penicillium hispanicum]